MIGVVEMELRMQADVSDTSLIFFFAVGQPPLTLFIGSSSPACSQEGSAFGLYGHKHRVWLGSFLSSMVFRVFMGFALDLSLL